MVEVRFYQRQMSPLLFEKWSDQASIFEEAKTLIDNYIYFYNHQRIQLKTGVAPLTLRHSA